MPSRVHSHSGDNSRWTILAVRETEFRGRRPGAQEAVFTIGNGYVSTRGTCEEGLIGDLPATLIHGVFDDASLVATALANAPDLLPLALRIGDEQVQLDAGTLLHNGVLTRTFRWQSRTGQTVDICYERFISLADKNVMVIRCRITPVDFTGPITLHAALDGNVDNAGLPHWNKGEQGHIDQQTIFLQSTTRATGIMLCEAARLQVEGTTQVDYRVSQRENVPTITARCRGEQGQTVTAEKVITLFTSYDAGRNTRAAALAKLAEVTAGANHVSPTGERPAWARAGPARI